MCSDHIITIIEWDGIKNAWKLQSNSFCPRDTLMKSQENLKIFDFCIGGLLPPTDSFLRI